MKKEKWYAQSPMDKEQKEVFLRKQRLETQCTNMKVFECAGRFYYGKCEDAVIRYIDQNPPIEFQEWLVDNWEALPLTNPLTK